MSDTSKSPAEAMRAAALAQCVSLRQFCMDRGVRAEPHQQMIWLACSQLMQVIWTEIGELPPVLDPRDAEIERLRAALTALNGHIEEMQGAARRYLSPGGFTANHFIIRTLYLLDGPEQRVVQDAARAALAPPPEPPA